MIRNVALAIAGVTAAVVLALFAFGGGTGTARAQANDSHGISNLSCNFSPSPVTLNTAETLTCTFDFFGTPHTFVADFEIATTTPPLGLQVTSCTLDGNKFSGGPCP